LAYDTIVGFKNGELIRASGERISTKINVTKSIANVEEPAFLEDTVAIEIFPIDVGPIITEPKLEGGKVVIDEEVIVVKEYVPPPSPSPSTSPTPTQTPSQTPTQTPSETSTPSPSKTPTPSQSSGTSELSVQSSPTGSFTPKPSKSELAAPNDRMVTLNVTEFMKWMNQTNPLVVQQINEALKRPDRGMIPANATLDRKPTDGEIKVQNVPDSNKQNYQRYKRCYLSYLHLFTSRPHHSISVLSITYRCRP